MAERYAQRGEQTETSKTQAIVAVKRVGAHIGLKAGDMLLLDTLSAFTQPQDWGAGQRPIVWASNAYLMDQTGFSLSALKRHARRLAEAGVLSFKDSPNGKRWGRRDVDGMIIEAYGFDLSPLSARVEEFEALQVDIQAERESRQRLKRQITVSRRMIRARIEAAVSNALHGPWKRFTDLFEALLRRLPRRNDASDQLEGLLTMFRALQDRVEAAFLKASKLDRAVEKTGMANGERPVETPKMNPREVDSEPHILTTNQPDPVTCNSLEKQEPAGFARDEQPNQRTRKPGKGRGDLELSTIMRACPEFASWARNLGGYVRNWEDLHQAAGRLRPMIGVSDHAWTFAQDQLGGQKATAAFALVFEKHCLGEVSSPGGYLRGMVEKAGAGELHLERSFYGRLSGRAA